MCAEFIRRSYDHVGHASGTEVTARSMLFAGIGVAGPSVGFMGYSLREGPMNG
jgi:hypothetical protein